MKLPLGYRYAATYAGIRKDHKDDLGLIVPETPASAAAVFTTNRVQSASIKVARDHLRASRGKVAAVVANAGNAVCATKGGEEAIIKACRAVAEALKVPVNQVLPASTGVIGVELDPSLIPGAVPDLVANLSEHHFPDVSSAIMTTDLMPKTAFGEVMLKEGEVQIAGMTKGSGMIAPQMATTLGFLMTDAIIAPVHLQKMLARCVERSYNQLSVDGEMSTNDIVILMANGASGIKPTEKERGQFEEVLQSVMEELAEQIARDGEGAKKLIKVRVMGAPETTAASRIARAIGNSPLVKTAVAGSDPNWGRILSAAGASGVEFDPNQVDIYMQGVQVCHSGLATDFNESEVKLLLDENEVVLRFVIRGSGSGETRFWTCDFTQDYIRINSNYRS